MIAIIKYNAGNIGSVQNAIRRIGYESVVTDDINLLNSADKIIFPGVGEASSAMKYLRERKLDEFILNTKIPLLGICLGMQLLCIYSEEGNTDGIGVFNTTVKKFPPQDIIPHMGWNEINSLQSKLFMNINENSNVYFVHSYYAEVCTQTIAINDYILPYSAALHKDNFYATQFHPEKSSSIGLKILSNFLTL